jgi:hypothetical protein
MQAQGGEPKGLRWDDDDGLPRRVTSADGTTLVRRDDGVAPRLWLRLPDHRELALCLDAAEHPVLGRCDLVCDDRGELLAHASASDWRRPTRIPALDRPGALPPGAGTAILNLLAWQAARAGAGPLRYHGPYPTAALWDALAASFRVDEPRKPARARFIADAEARALAGTLGEIDVDFHAAPHVWAWPRPRICVQRREGIERVWLDGRAFDRAGLALRRLQRDGDAIVARIAVGDEVWAELLRLRPDGEPLGEPVPLPAGPTELLGTLLPSAVVEVLGQVVVAEAPRALQPALRHVLGRARIGWGDPGLDLVAWRGDVLELHAGLVSVLPTEPTALLGVLVRALAPPLRRAAAAVLDAAWSAACGAPEPMRAVVPDAVILGSPDAPPPPTSEA